MILDETKRTLINIYAFHGKKIKNLNFTKNYDQILRKLGSWSYLPKKSSIENCIFCVVSGIENTATVCRGKCDLAL